jgi:hypothetical protein
LPVVVAAALTTPVVAVLAACLRATFRSLPVLNSWSRSAAEVRPARVCIQIPSPVETEVRVHFWCGTAAVKQLLPEQLVAVVVAPLSGM